MKNKDPFETCCWNFSVLTESRQVFAECFAYADINSFRNTIRQVLLAAGSNKVYNKEEPAYMLGIFKAITSAMLAAHELQKQKQCSSLKITPAQYMDKRLYARPGVVCAEWEWLPHALTAKEYENPYTVFKHFFKYKDMATWRKDINQILDYALSRDTADCVPDLLPLYLHLPKLMEAAHLIDVREVLHVGGVLKPG
ncbi:MAG: hypothetical protein J7539_05830 [Niabella sp.]|nr:hypothetical protein [Niabella sp.]